MTIKLIGKFNDLYDGFKLKNDRVQEILDLIKSDIIEDHEFEDPNIFVSKCELFDEPLIYGMQGVGVLHVEVVVVTFLSRVCIRQYDYPWDNMIELDQQNKWDYDYDCKFFYIARANCERHCEEVQD